MRRSGRRRALHRAEGCRRVPERRTAQALRSDLEARGRQPDAVRDVEYGVGRSRLRAANSAFRASGTTVVDPGFLAVYEEGRDQKNAEDEDEGRKLPAMTDRRSGAAARRRRRPAFHRAAAALFRSLAGQDARGIRHRPAVDLREHHPGAAQSRIRDRSTAAASSRPTSAARSPSSCRAISPNTSTTTSPRSSRTSSTRSAAARRTGCRCCEKFWKPFKAQVDDKNETVDRSEASGARELGTRSEKRQAGAGAPRPLWTVRADRHEGRRGQAEVREPCVPARACTRFRCPRRSSSSSCRATLGKADDGEDITVGVGRFGPFVKHGKIMPRCSPRTIRTRSSCRARSS